METTAASTTNMSSSSQPSNQPSSSSVPPEPHQPTASNDSMKQKSSGPTSSKAAKLPPKAARRLPPKAARRLPPKATRLPPRIHSPWVTGDGDPRQGEEGEKKRRHLQDEEARRAEKKFKKHNEMTTTATTSRNENHPGNPGAIVRKEHKKRPPMKTATNSNGTATQQQPQGPVECTGQAAIALHKFKERVTELKNDAKFKPDMVAYKELNGKYLSDRRRHGELPGVPIGLQVEGRGEAAILGIHRSILSGIDGVKDEPCFAVCISGGYDDSVNQDGSIIYTGAGGQDKSGKHQIKDQVENTANRSLILSQRHGKPIRLLRGKFGNYRYVGLYECTEYSLESSTDGPLVYKFTLVPIEGKTVVSSAMSMHRKRLEKKLTGKTNQNKGPQNNGHKPTIKTVPVNRWEMNTNNKSSASQKQQQQPSQDTAPKKRLPSTSMASLTASSVTNSAAAAPKPVPKPPPPKKKLKPLKLGSLLRKL